MTEPAWGSSSPSNGPTSNTDFHHQNLKHLKKIQARARQQQQQDQLQARHRQPVKAFIMPENKFAPVQPRLYDWTATGNGPNPTGVPVNNGTASQGNGRRSPSVHSTSQNYSHVQSRVQDWTCDRPDVGSLDSKQYLKSHQKTGPFLPSSAASVASGFRRIRAKDRSPPEDFDTVDDAIHVAMASSSNSRFSEVTVDERKRRIQYLISEIYSVTPLCKENVTRKTLEKNLRRFASCERVSEAGSLFAESTKPEHRPSMSHYGSHSKLNGPRVSKAPSSGIISVNNVEPLTRAQLKRHDAKHPTLHTRELISIRDTQISPGQHRQTTLAKPRISPSLSSNQRDRSISPDGRISRGSRHSQTRPGTGGEEGSVLGRGIDIDYVNANIESVSVVGHNKRKEVKAANDAAKVTKPSLIMPVSYKTGSVPKYLVDRQTEWREEAERKEREKPDPDCPPNHYRLPDEARIEALKEMKSKFDELLLELSRFSVRADSIRIRQRKRDIEEEIKSLESKMKIYNRPKVFLSKYMSNS